MKFASRTPEHQKLVAELRKEKKKHDNQTLDQ